MARLPIGYGASRTMNGLDQVIMTVRRYRLNLLQTMGKDGKISSMPLTRPPRLQATSMRTELP